MTGIFRRFSRMDEVLASIPSRVVIRTLLILVLLDLWVIVALISPPSVPSKGPLTADDRKAFHEAISSRTRSLAIQAFVNQYVDWAREAMGWRKTMVCDRFFQMPDGSCWVHTTMDPSVPQGWTIWNLFVRTNGSWRISVWGATNKQLPFEIRDHD